MTTATLVQSPMVKFLERFRNASQSLVVSGQLSGELANEMYIALRKEKAVMEFILPLIMAGNDGNNDAFSGFEFAFTDAEYEEQIYIDGEFYDQIVNSVVANYDTFSIHKVCIHQDEDDFMNYVNPCGEDRWLTSIIFRIHSIV